MYLLNFILKISKKMGVSFLNRKINDIIHNYWYNNLNPYFQKAENEIKNSKVSSYNSNKIWFFWWQGENQMPSIIKSCYKSCLDHSNNHDVVLVTKENFRQYTNLDRNILNKFNDGKISLTFMSDVIRFNLLKIHGGLWIDSTVYVNTEIKDVFFQNIFTIGIDDRTFHDSVNGGYSSFLIGGKNIIFDFMDAFYRIFYSTNDCVKYYFTLDTALNYCYINNIGGFKDYVDDISFSSDPLVHKLITKINNKYSQEEYKQVENRFYKLTYKMSFNCKDDTYYKRIVEGKFPFC